MILIFNLLWSEFVETNATFRSASTDLDHLCVIKICRSRSKCRIRFNRLAPKKVKNYYDLDNDFEVLHMSTIPLMSYVSIHFVTIS